MSNILSAIINIANNPVLTLRASYTGRNSINNVGEALEAYIQDAFANTITENDSHTRNEKIAEIFSYLGNQNNPPDIILENGDAIEVKKIQTTGAAIALNSSYPKNKLYADDPKITDTCRHCEEWDKKDIIYAIGVTNDDDLKHLWFVYGDCYAANRETYSRISETIKTGITAIGDVEFSETKELGRVNRVDPLGITNLRIRGMWHIDNPLKVFQDYYNASENSDFSLACILRDDKYKTFNQTDRQNIENHSLIHVKNIRINDPNNPANLLDAKLITLEIA
jgi:hypothetical protein